MKNRTEITFKKIDNVRSEIMRDELLRGGSTIFKVGINFTREPFPLVKTSFIFR